MKTIYFIACLTLLLSCHHQTPKEKHLAVIKASLEYQIQAQLGEGAFWNHETQELYWVDILEQSLHIYDPKTSINKSFKMPTSIGTVVPSEASHEALVALQDGIYIVDTKNGDLKLFSNVERHIPSNRFNDGKCDPAGRFWVGSMAFSQEAHKANLYMIDAKGDAVLKKDSVTISNGIVWTKDKKTMYYIDTPTAEVKAYDYNNSTGEISNERVAITVNDSLGFPDGMAIDENDNLWVGMWNGNAVIQFDPKTGKIISKVEVPAHNVTSCAFGGTDLNTLYITTSSVDMNEAEQKAYPLAGSLFKVKTKVRGVKSSFFKTK